MGFLFIYLLKEKEVQTKPNITASFKLPWSKLHLCISVSFCAINPKLNIYIFADITWLKVTPVIENKFNKMSLNTHLQNHALRKGQVAAYEKEV